MLVEPSAERTFVTTLGAERDISTESLDTSRPRPGDLVCVTGFSLALASTRDPLLAWLGALDEEVVVVLDPGSAFASLDAERPRPDARPHRRVDQQRRGGGRPAGGPGHEPTDDGLVARTEALAPLMRGDAVVIVRDGAAGCAVLADGTATLVPGFPQTPLDTNGAGDTHTGALLAEVAAGTPWVEGCRRANAAAAIKVTRRGPTTAPTSAEVQEFLADQDRLRADDGTS